MPICKGIKARPHDIQGILKLKPELIEIHASSEDLSKEINGQYDVPLVVHFPEYDGSELMDPASPTESKRIHAREFYQRALDKTREWGKHFKGDVRAIIHPGGWSSEPLKVSERKPLYEAFHKTMSELKCDGVDLLVENMPPQPWFYGGQWNCSIFMDPTESLEHCKSHGYGFCLDVCHAFLYCNYVKNIDIIDFVKTLLPLVRHVHISDGRGVDGEGIQIGEGDMPLKEILSAIQNVKGGVVPEIWLGHKDDFAGFKIAWERIDALMASAVATS